MPLLLSVDVTGRLVLVVGCGPAGGASPTLARWVRDRVARAVPLDDALDALVRGDVEGAQRLVNGPAPSAER